VTYDERLLDILRRMRRHIEKTTDALVPSGEILKLDEEEQAQRRWQIHLGVLLTDATRSLEKLAKANEIRMCVVLSRCIYEYCLSSQYYAKHRDKALALYRTVPKRHYYDMQKLAPLDAASEAEMSANYMEWLKSSGVPEKDMRIPGVPEMAADLADPSEVLKDFKNVPYVQDETMANAVPSWYVHGRPQLIMELFDAWDDPMNWRYFKEVRIIRRSSIIRSVIGGTGVYLIKLRRAYGMEVESVQKTFREAWDLGGFDKQGYS
jgi:hypothetical protein